MQFPKQTFDAAIRYRMNDRTLVTVIAVYIVLYEVHVYFFIFFKKEKRE